jgi:hypothetical protein
MIKYHSLVIIFLLTTSGLCFGQRGILLSDPNRGSDTFRIYKYADTVFNNYQSYGDVRDFVKERFPFSYSLNNCQFIGIANYFYNIEKKKGSKKRMKPGLFELTNSNGEVLSLYGSFNARFEGDSLSHLVFGSGDFASLSLKKSKIGKLVIGADTLRSLHVDDSVTHINRVLIWGSFINEIAINYLADTIELYDIRIDRPLNFKGAIRMDNRNHIHHLRILSKDVDKLDFEYHNFRLYFRGEESYDDKIGVYTALLESFKRKGYLSSYEKLDKEFQEFQYNESGILGNIFNWTVKNWWDYGYEKKLILRNAIILNSIFLIINFLLFKKLIKHGYKAREFITVNSSLKKKYSSNKLKLAILRFPYVFIYTCYIFWGLRLDIKNLGIHRIKLFGYILFQYVVGLICLAYLANWIITS